MVTRRFTFNKREFNKYGGKESFERRDHDLDISTKTYIYGPIRDMLQKAYEDTKRVVITTSKGDEGEILYNSEKGFFYPYSRGFYDSMAKIWQNRVGNITISNSIYNSQGYYGLTKLKVRLFGGFNDSRKLTHMYMARYTRGIFKAPIPHLDIFDLAFSVSYSAAKWLVQEKLVSDAFRDEILYMLQEWDYQIEKTLSDAETIIKTGGEPNPFINHRLRGDKFQNGLRKLNEAGYAAIYELKHNDVMIFYPMSGLTEIGFDLVYVISVCEPLNQSGLMDLFRIMQRYGFELTDEVDDAHIGRFSFEYKIKENDPSRFKRKLEESGYKNINLDDCSSLISFRRILNREIKD